MSYSVSINDSMNVFPLISFVVSITNSTLESSCWLMVRSADISWYVQPPMKNTRMTLGFSMEDEFSLEMELRRAMRGCKVCSSSTVWPGRRPNTSWMPGNIR